MKKTIGILIIVSALIALIISLTSDISFIGAFVFIAIGSIFAISTIEYLIEKS